MSATSSTAVLAGGFTFRPLGEEAGREYLAVQEEVFSNTAEEIIPGMF